LRRFLKLMAALVALPLAAILFGAWWYRDALYMEPPDLPG